MPVLISGGLQTAERCARAFEQTGAAASARPRVRWATRGCSSRCWGDASTSPAHDEILSELDWVIDSAVEHLGDERATRYLRKFYPWYVERLGGGKALQAALQTAPSLDAARELLREEPARLAVTA